MDNKEYLEEWRDLLTRDPNEVYYSYTDRDGETEVRTIEDRKYSVAGVFAIEGWAIPPSMDKYLN
jgi:hypothetical protein